MLKMLREGEEAKTRNRAPASTGYPAASNAAHCAEVPSVRCGNCAMRTFCMAADLGESEVLRLERAVQGWRTVHQGQRLFRTGDLFTSLYAIRAGSFKTVVTPERGREYISGFYMAGDAIGLDGISRDQHGSDAVALEDSVVCVLPYPLLEAACRERKPLQRQFHKLLSTEIVREARQMMVLGNMSAEQRVANFLLSVSARHKERGYSGTAFLLRMTREDIGSYLGVTLETVSRTLSKFQQEGLIVVQGKSIELTDPEALGGR